MNGTVEGPTPEELRAKVERAARKGGKGRPDIGAMSRAERDEALFGTVEGLVERYEGHTPGPWRACAFSSIVGCPVTAQPDPTKNTFNVCGVAAPVSREENIANARLIADAPKLLAQLVASREALDDLLDYTLFHDSSLDHESPLVVRCRAALTIGSE